MTVTHGPPSGVGFSRRRFLKGSGALVVAFSVARLDRSSKPA